MVSIITPCYNSSKYLKDCIESVLNQSYSDWEMIIVDDCSTDNSLQIIGSFKEKDPRIKSFKTDKPSGSPVLPRNMGISKAQGRYIAFLDSDDIWLPVKLEEQLEFLISNDTSFVFSNYEKMSNDGSRSNRVVIAPSKVGYKDMYYGNSIGCLTVLLDSCKLGNVFFENLHHEDCIAWIKILKKGVLAFNTNTVLAVYRESDNSVSSNKWKVISWQWNIYRKIFNLNLIMSFFYFIYYSFNAYKKARI